jgi:hypothetical protein
LEIFLRNFLGAACSVLDASHTTDEGV